MIPAAGAPTSAFDIAAAPVLIPPGPWKTLENGGVCSARGFLANGMAAGLRASGPKADLALVAVDPSLPPAAAAGVFTKNVMCAAPVTFCRKALEKSPTARAVLINAGQANAATGDQGYADCEASASALRGALKNDESLLLLSTGVIGRRIKMEPLIAALPTLVGGLGSSDEDALHAAVAVTTTDLVSKSAALEIDVEGAKIRVGGFAKGSGMIHPNMATMLSVVTTDAAVDPALWREMLRSGADASFNQISVDGDTSTNDTVIGLASGAAPGAELIKNSTDPGAATLQAAVTALLQGLAKSVAWDGEGATCLLEVTVEGADSDADARLAAKAVASSSLVKAAVFGHDPNWGRIACAAGYSGAVFKQENLDVSLGEIALMKSGQPLEFDAERASAYLKETTAVHGTVEVKLNLGNEGGKGSGVAWGCDLSYDYVKINAEYTT